MNEKLKPCPFCGAEMKLDHELARYGDKVFHPDNGCSVIPFATDPKDWNARPIEGALRAEVEAVRARLASATLATVEVGSLNVDLQIENDRLREALKKIADGPAHYLAAYEKRVRTFAREILKGNQP